MAAWCAMLEAPLHQERCAGPPAVSGGTRARAPAQTAQGWHLAAPPPSPAGHARVPQGVHAPPPARLPGHRHRVRAGGRPATASAGRPWARHNPTPGQEAALQRGASQKGEGDKGAMQQNAMAGRPGALTRADPAAVRRAAAPGRLGRLCALQVLVLLPDPQQPDVHGARHGGRPQAAHGHHTDRRHDFHLSHRVSGVWGCGRRRALGRAGGSTGAGLQTGGGVCSGRADWDWEAWGRVGGGGRALVVRAGGTVGPAWDALAGLEGLLAAAGGHACMRAFVWHFASVFGRLGGAGAPLPGISGCLAAQRPASQCVCGACDAQVRHEQVCERRAGRAPVAHRAAGGRAHGHGGHQHCLRVRHLAGLVLRVLGAQRHAAGACGSVGVGGAA